MRVEQEKGRRKRRKRMGREGRRGKEEEGGKEVRQGGK